MNQVNTRVIQQQLKLNLVLFVAIFKLQVNGM